MDLENLDMLPTLQTLEVSLINAPSSRNSPIHRIVRRQVPFATILMRSQPMHVLNMVRQFGDPFPTL